LILADYLARAGRKRFAWGGEIDCWTFGLDWVRECVGIDPLGDFRGSYSDARQARCIVRDQGGAFVFADSLLRAVGLESAAAVRPGDIGIAWAAWRKFHGRTILAHATALCIRPKLWAIKPADGGIMLADFPIAHAWTLPTWMQPNG
jgi:hypothetical protein